MFSSYPVSTWTIHGQEHGHGQGHGHGQLNFIKDEEIDFHTLHNVRSIIVHGTCNYCSFCFFKSVKD